MQPTDGAVAAAAEVAQDTADVPTDQPDTCSYAAQLQFDVAPRPLFRFQKQFTGGVIAPCHEVSLLSCRHCSKNAVNYFQVHCLYIKCLYAECVWLNNVCLLWRLAHG